MLDEKIKSKYASYKPCSIDGVYEIPKTWEEVALDTISKIKSEINHQDKELLSVYLRRGVIRFSDVTEKRTNVSSLDLSNYQHVEKGDFVLNNQQAWRGSVGVSDYEGIVSPAYLVLRLSEKLDRRYANFLFRESVMVGQYLTSSKGVGTIQRNLYWPQLKRKRILLPPKLEQVAIANFLDDKTEKIDRAIAIKEAQIARLEERKQILIQTAVTRGLDPNVPMKDSAVDWIGEIPVHWEEIRMCYIFRFSKGLTITKEDLRDEGIPCMNYGEIHSRFGFDVNPRLDELKCVDADYLETSANSLLRDGDFVFADTSEDLEGSGNFTYLNSNCLTFAGYHTVIARNLSDNKSRYLAYLFSAQAFRGQIRKSVNGVKVYTISQTKLRNPITIIPPVSEQIEIIQHLDKETQKITMVIDGIQSQISHLKEYRASLINAAVTGKIKVTS